MSGMRFLKGWSILILSDNRIIEVYRTVFISAADKQKVKIALWLQILFDKDWFLGYTSI